MFTGTVVEVLGPDERFVLVTVDEVWKGADLPAEVEVWGGTERNAGMVTSVDRFYEAGTDYVFFPTTDREPFLDNLCTLTQPLTAGLTALRPDDAREPSGEATTGGGTTGNGGGAVDGGIDLPPPGGDTLGPDEPVTTTTRAPIAAEDLPNSGSTGTIVMIVSLGAALALAAVGYGVGRRRRRGPEPAWNPDHRIDTER